MYYNWKRVPALEIQPGDKVFVDAWNLQTTWPSQKLNYRFIGPYTVERKVGNNAYQVKLPPSMNRVHLVFHVVKLKLAPQDPIGRHVQPPPDPVVIGGEPEYKVEHILDSWMFQRKLQFLVSWKGYGIEENTWVNEEDLHAPRLVMEFYRLNPGALRQIRLVSWGCFDLARGVMSENPYFPQVPQSFSDTFWYFLIFSKVLV